MSKARAFRIERCQDCPRGVCDAYPSSKARYCGYNKLQRRIRNEGNPPSWCPLPPWKEEEK